jgi:cytochrome P450
LNLGVSEQLTVRYALRRLGTLRVWPARDRANKEIDDVVMPLIAQRRSDPRLNEQLDILALLMCARGEDGEMLSDSEIRDDVITLMLAGHETTATTLRHQGPVPPYRGLRAVAHRTARLRRIVIAIH